MPIIVAPESGQSKAVGVQKVLDLLLSFAASLLKAFHGTLLV